MFQPWVNEQMRNMTQWKVDELSQISLRDPKGIPIGSLDFHLHSAPSIYVTLPKMADE